MSRDTSALRHTSRNVSKLSQSEANENEFETSMNLINFPPPRTPLNTIQDPSQCQKDCQEMELKSRNRKFEAAESNSLQSNKGNGNGNGNGGSSCGTPMVSGRGLKAQSEPNSAQSSPARSVSKNLSIGQMGACSGSRPPYYIGGRGASSSRVSRGISTVTSEPNLEVPHFELEVDPSFWMDHNVQVLIRIRPINGMERVSQGYGQCLRQESSQTLVWLGHPETRFTFDHIACETISQEKLFRIAGLPMVENCMSGYNSCMFAYGQTGSGKTYTMMGDIYEMESELNENCGITPRIFEYLFTRISVEEENRMGEKLKYSCKCSFLEIYNEQITDLLEPSSTNLQLREDLKKGVYVENLTEYNVKTVNDVVKLLLEGAANRKMAATYMNRESSRSHSVFTCIIESRWEKDSMNHLRFARLNLVDLAGSERQKSSGAEGERLKEAANINKSLSTLGLVIMSLVDLAQGRQRHVPYRDSRLTFLLQDSLGGNSKTMIIANVSPSICTANETLSTLKFAQRAKLIQNNAKVNEDASGDVFALQRQIQLLKGQLSFLMKHHNLPRSLSCNVPCSEDSRLVDFAEESYSTGEHPVTDYHNILSVQNKKMKDMKAILVGALRREKLSETAAKKLKAEIEHMIRLAQERELDAQHAKLMLRFREEKIKRLEFLAEGSISAEEYLMEEKKAFLGEIQLLQSRIDRNPELTRFAVENIRLVEQLQLFQNFYEQGERETLMAEVSELRDQLLEALETPLKLSSEKGQDINTLKELEDCKNMNSRLMREVDELQTQLGKYVNCGQAELDSVIIPLSKYPMEFLQTDKCSLFPLSKDESISVRSDSGDNMASYNWADDEVLQINNDQNMGVKFDMQPSDMQKELMDARFLIDGMGSEQLRLIEELQLLQEKNERCLKVSSNKEKFKRQSMSKDDRSYLESGLPRNQNNVLATELNGDIIRTGLQTKLDEVTKDLEEARLLTIRYREDQETIVSHQHQVESVFDEVEIETTNTILHLQEEVAALQLELQERLCCTTQENTRLRETIAAKEEEMRALRLEWEAATVELTNFLTEGSKSLKDASAQIEGIACSFPQDNVWICEQVQRAARAFVEKEEIVMLLQKSLEDAQNMVQEMGLKLSSLKNATIAFNEVQQLESDESTKQPMQLGMPLDNMIRVLERKLKCKEDQTIEAEKRADAALIAVKRLGDHQNVFLGHDFRGEIDACKLAFPAEKDIHQKLEPKNGAEAISLEDIEVQVELARLGILESEDAIKSSYADAETHLTSLQADICSISSAYMELVQDLVKDIHEIKEDLRNLKEYQFCPVDSLSLGPCNSPMLENQYCILHKVRAELVETNDRLNTIKDCINTLTNVRVGPEMAEDILEADEWSTDCSTSGSDFSTTSLASQNKVDISSTYCSRWPGEIIEGKLNLKFEEALPPLPSSNQVSEKLKMILKSSAPDETTLLCLKKELDMAFNAFNEIYVWVVVAFNEKGIGAFSFTPERSQWHLSCKAETSCCGTEELAADTNMKPANSFLDKIEEVHATIREADFMLNALLKANENAKEFSAMWKKAGEELMLERASLMEEVEQLKSSLCLKEQENEILCYQFHNSLVEVENSMTLLEESFLQLRRDVEEWFEVTYSDVLSMGRDILSSTCDSKIYLEDFCSEMMEKGFASFRRYQCKLSEFHQKMPSFAEDSSFLPLWRQKSLSLCSNKYDNMSRDTEGIKERSQNVVETYLEEGKIGLTNDSMIFENMSLKKELEKKEVLLKGLLFDFSLLQESASKTKDFKDETEKLIFALGQVRHELEMKTSQLDNILVQHRKVEGRMSETETAILLSNSQLDQARDTIDMLSDQNAELTLVLKDLYFKKSEVEEQLEEQKETVKGLEKEILRLTSPMEKKLLSSVEDFEDELRRVSSERDQLREEVYSLNDKLEVAYALADENKAVAVEARQESEASKIYAEQKEEEVKILERSVEELESTINVLEKKVYELDEEVGRQQLIRDSLELELQFLRQRLLTVENFTENMVSENINVEQTTYQRQLHSRSVELQETHNRIRFLEEERAEQNREIKQLNEYISELVLHAEAQASQYQQKYKTLENMVHEVKADSLNSTSTALPEKTEKSSTRTRGSSSPFRCIASFVQQMNLEKDHELSMARLHIEELEALAASRQKEVCMLNSRLAATESMTHDVIRDLLGVKLDMTNYANLIDQQQVQKLVEAAQHETEESLAKEQEVLNLRKQLTNLIDERESCQLELHKKEADILAAQIAVEQLQLRDQLLSAQNEMLKVDKSKLKRKVAELDEMVKKLFNTQSPQQRIRQPTKTKESSTLRLGNADFNKSLAHSEKILSHVNHELAQYRKK